jgi:hypothetical protein
MYAPLNFMNTWFLVELLDSQDKYVDPCKGQENMFL